MQYCSWAYALLVSSWTNLLYHIDIFKTSQQNMTQIFLESKQRKEVGPEACQYEYPETVLSYIRTVVPGDIKGEKIEVSNTLYLENQ